MALVEAVPPGGGLGIQFICGSSETRLLVLLASWSKIFN
jgi:hypothetical protein